MDPNVRLVLDRMRIDETASQGHVCRLSAPPPEGYMCMYVHGNSSCWEAVEAAGD